MFRSKLRGAAIPLALLLATTTYCHKDIPVQELTDARTQLDAASEENAAQFAPTQYEQAKAALLEAHRELGDEKYDKARAKALESTAQSLAARQESAPKANAAAKESAQQNLSAADEAYAETLASADFSAAQSLFAEGEKLEGTARSQAGDAVSSKSLEGQMTALGTYSNSTRKYNDSAAAADRAKNVALAQKGDMMDSLDGIRAALQKAESWGAAENDPEGLAAAKEKLAQAESDIEAGKLKSGSMAMKDADAASKELLAKMAASHAAQKLEEAKKSVAGAEGNFAEINTAKNQKNEETKAALVAIETQLAAAREARDAGERLLGENKFEDSIGESEDAIRLSQIVFEQYTMLAARTRGDMAEETTTETTTTSDEQLPAGWREYIVKSTDPAECLWCIAKSKQFYGNGFLWKRIYQANKDAIKNPNLIYPNQRLLIPPKKGKIVPPKVNRPAETAPATSTENAIEAPVDPGEAPAETVTPSSEEPASDSMESGDATKSEENMNDGGEQPTENMQ